MIDTKRTDIQTEALATLYRAAAATKAKGPNTIRELSAEDRTAYDRENKRQQRERAKAARESGRLEASDASSREALADAAILLLAVGGPGADEIQKAVHKAFTGGFAVAGTVRARCRAATLRPRVLTVERMAAKA